MKHSLLAGQLSQVAAPRRQKGNKTIEGVTLLSLDDTHRSKLAGSEFFVGTAMSKVVPAIIFNGD